MRTIGIDVNALTRPQRTGVERYLLALLRAMMLEPLQADERVILYSSAIVSDFGSLPTGWEWKILPFKLSKGWTHLRLSWELFWHAPDIFFSPAHEVPLLTGKAKVITTVHDVAFRVVPEAYDAKSRRRQEWAIGRAIKKASRLLAISEATKSDLVRLFGVDASKIAVAQLALIEGSQGGQGSQGLRSRVLFIGRMEAKKNVATLVRAWGEIGPVGPVLTLVGSPGYGFDEIEKTIKEKNLGDSVDLQGYVDDAKLDKLWDEALIFAFPSRYEGFGFPILEAMSHSVPVIASDIPALREVGGDAAMFVAPDDIAGWARAIAILATDDAKRVDLVARGHERINQFSWATTAQKTWEAIRSL